MERSPDLESAARKWSQDLPQLQRLKSLAQRLVACTTSEAFQEKHRIIGAIRKEHGLPDNVEEAVGWVRATLEDLARLTEETHGNTLKQADVSQARLDELGRVVPDYVLAASDKVFPFNGYWQLRSASSAGVEITREHSGSIP